jgi:hypothetical protein
VRAHSPPPPPPPAAVDDEEKDEVLKKVLKDSKLEELKEWDDLEEELPCRLPVTSPSLSRRVAW